MPQWVSSFDVGYAARQVTIVAILALAPAVLWSALKARRLLAVVVAPSLILTIAWLLFDVLYVSSRVWSGSDLPYIPFRVGPSVFTLRELVWWLAMSLWAPSLAVYLLLRLWTSRRAPKPYSQTAIVVRLLSYMLLAVTWTTLTLMVAEYDHEDTVVAEGFSEIRWQQLQPGMSRAEVQGLLGPPLRGHCQFDQGPECWVSNYSAGHFAGVWFEGDRATRIQRWYSD